MITERKLVSGGVMDARDMRQCTADATQCVDEIWMCDWHAAEALGEHDASGTEYDQATYRPPG